MGDKLGYECKLYRNSASHANPTWVEVSNVKDVTLNLEKGDVDATTRGNMGWKASKAALKAASIDFEMVYDTTDANFQAFKNAFLNNTTVEVAVMDGPIATVGSEGLRATMDVMKFPRSEPLEGEVMTAVSLKPTYAANAPEWKVVAA